jgi:hypothetical protein
LLTINLGSVVNPVNNSFKSVAAIFKKMGNETEKILGIFTVNGGNGDNILII